MLNQEMKGQTWHWWLEYDKLKTYFQENLTLLFEALLFDQVVEVVVEFDGGGELVVGVVELTQQLDFLVA